MGRTASRVLETLGSIVVNVCGNSSVGRARPCQGRGREFESRFPLQFYIALMYCFQRGSPLLRPGGRVVMQRIANPCTPVRFRPRPPSLCFLSLARMAKLVDARDLKSLDRKIVPVRPRLRAPISMRVSKRRSLPDNCLKTPLLRNFAILSCLSSD